jgi:catalase
MVPLVVAPHGGKLPDGIVVQRGFGATRSVEFDAVILAGGPVSGTGRPGGARQQGSRR